MHRSTVLLNDEDYYEIKKLGISYSSCIKLGLNTVKGITDQNLQLKDVQDRLRVLEDKVARWDGRHTMLIERISKLEGGCQDGKLL